MFVGLSAVGYAGLAWIALAAALAVWARRPLLATTVLTAACVWGADLLSLVVKVLVDRRRPFEGLPEYDTLFPRGDPLLGGTVGSSMPSGHAATSFAGAVVLAALVRRAVPGLFLLALAVAYSRVYVGVHYPSDVLAGAALGTAFAGVFLAALRRRPRSGGGPPRSGAAPPPG